MVQFLLKLLLKQNSCCVPRFPLIFTAKYHSLYVKESGSEVLQRSGVGVRNCGKVGVGSRSWKFWKCRSWSRIFYLRLRNPGYSWRKPKTTLHRSHNAL